MDSLDVDRVSVAVDLGIKAMIVYLRIGLAFVTHCFEPSLCFMSFTSF